MMGGRGLASVGGCGGGSLEEARAARAVRRRIRKRGGRFFMCFLINKKETAGVSSKERKGRRFQNPHVLCARYH